MEKKEKIVWLGFIFSIVLICLQIWPLFNYFFAKDSYQYKIFFYSLPFLIFFSHSFLTLSKPRALLFLLLAMVTGWLFETIGLIGGTFFGVHYIYNPNQLFLFLVPISVIIYWIFFIYTGYCVTNSFLLWLNLKKPVNRHNLKLLPLLIIIDAIIVVAIDLFMDPLQVKIGNWQWVSKGIYFGVPIGNFIGWFIVVVIVTGLFRLYEYFSVDKKMKYNKLIMIMPVIGYGGLTISFITSAIKYQMYDLAVTGSFLMIFITLSNLFLFTRWILKRRYSN